MDGPQSDPEQVRRGKRPIRCDWANIAATVRENQCAIRQNVNGFRALQVATMV